MPKIFVSYRRDDSDVIAGRIRDWLARIYGDKSVFMDIDTIPVGVDFREHVKGALLQNNVLIAVIGPHWLGRADGGQTRIQEETDPVRVEIEAALQRGTPVVPVLVHGASMPKPADLPSALKNFAFYNAAIVDSGRDFQHHMDGLIRSINDLLKVASPPRQRPWLWAAAGALAAAVVLIPAGWLYLKALPQAVSPAVSPSIEARAMFVRAVAELKANETAALVKFNSYDNEFFRYMFVFCFNLSDGRYTAHANKSLIGTDIRLFKDKDGISVGEQVFNAARDGRDVTVEYQFPLPGGIIPIPSAAHIFRAGTQGCGVRFNK